MAKCLICERRPATSNGYCHNCDAKVAAARKTEGAWWRKAFRYAVWRGMGIALMTNGNGNYKTIALPASALAKLPKAKTINLDGYAKGYTREQVKKIKAAILGANGN